MSLFDDEDNPFDSIVREFFGGSSNARRVKRKDQFIKGEDEDRNIDYVEDDKKIYLVFELPGFNEKDVAVIVKGNTLEVHAQKLNGEGIADYLNQKLKQGISFTKELPSFVNSKDFSHTMRNGVLEIVFGRGKSKK